MDDTITKECRICSNSFEAKTDRRELCDKCQKNSTRAQRIADRHLYESKKRLGELPSQQYHQCECKYCHKKFVRFGRSAEHCSRDCIEKSNTENAKCPVCQKLLLPLGIISTKNKPCSEKCKHEYKWILARDRGHVGNCKECDKEFIRSNPYMDLCSKECKKVYNEKHETKSLKTAQVVKVTSRCPVCRGLFQKAPKGHPACSVKCRNVYNKVVQKKKDAEERKRLVADVICGKVVGDRAKSLHLCINCRTSQSKCEMFTSKFVYHPEGVVIKFINGSNVVLECPSYKE